MGSQLLETGLLAKLFLSSLQKQTLSSNEVFLVVFVCVISNPFTRVKEKNCNGKDPRSNSGKHQLEMKDDAKNRHWRMNCWEIWEFLLGSTSLNRMPKGST